MPSNRLKALLAAFLACVCVSFTPAAAQEQHYRVIQRLSLPDEPLDELEVEVGGRAVKLNSFFHAERDWLKGLKVKARNVSGRRIVFADISLVIPQRGAMELPLGIPITYGQLPAIDSPPAPEEKLVAPGQVFKLTLSDQKFDTAMSFLAKHQVTEIVEAKMTGLMIVFDDGTAWNNGVRLRRDLSQPYRWVPAKRGEVSRTTGKFQSVGWKRPPGAFVRWAATEEVRVQCYTHFSYDYALCGTTTGNNACIVEEHTPRPRDNDDIPAPSQYLSSRSEICQGANCASVSKMVKRAEINGLCGYSGGNEWQ